MNAIKLPTQLQKEIDEKTIAEVEGKNLWKVDKWNWKTIVI